MIGLAIGPYRVIRQLGAGGMGVVYEAEDTRLGRRVAIKFLPEDLQADEEAVQRFMREARVVSNLNHPHICTLHDVGTHPSTPDRSSDAQPVGRSGQARQFMVMELLQGQSLKERIGRGPLPIDETLELGAQMADALDAAHSQGIVHRDVKPANLFITSRGHLKVLDFGVAKLGHAKSREPDVTMAESGQLTTMGTTIGTVSYMSPEQARGQEIDARSDVFSAGVVLYEMATGQLPFKGATVATIFEGLLTKQPAPPSQLNGQVPVEFDRIIAKALEKDAETRYQSAADLRADLKRLKRTRDTGVLSTAPALPAASTAHPAAAPPARSASWKAPLFVGAPLLTVLLAAGFWFYRTTATPALTSRDGVVLSPVMNRTGDTMFDDTLGEALALQLRQSPFLNVVPDQQVQATLRLMGRDPMTPVTGEVGREVCQRAGARALLGGTIAMLGSAYVLTLSAHDCVDGTVLAEQQTQAASKETVLTELGAAASRFREQLGESLASVQRFDAKIEEATTRSLEALKAYSQGIRTRRMTGDFDSVPLFRRAIELDPEFALAYARLGTVYNNLGQDDEARKMTARAYELRGKVSEVERLYIEARYHTLVQPDVQKALDAYNVWLATYPNDYVALQNSALLHKQQGDRAEAIRKLELATKVAPNEPLGWTNLGQTYFEALDFTNARRAYDAALQLRDSTSARIGLYQIAVLAGDLALADAQVSAVRGRRDEVDMVGVRMFGAAHRGRFTEAAELAADFQARALALSRGSQAGQVIAALAINEAIAGLDERARQRIETAENDGLLSEATLDEQMVVAAITADAATAQTLLQSAIEAERSTGSPGDGERGMRALAALAARRPQEAVSLLEPVTFDSGYTDFVSIWSIAKLQVGDDAAAAKGLAFLNSPEARVQLGATAAFAHAMLARVQARMGQVAEARQSYEKLFTLWKDADPDLPLLVEARAEFAKLGS
jgi:serine/threonine protein kinase/tetratricopeptide (TPR) repeat protein